MKKITLILLSILALTTFTSCEEDANKEMFVLRDIKKNYDNSLDLSNWECFQCFGTDKNNYEFFFVREVNENCVEKLFVINGNGYKTYESCTVTQLDTITHYISIINMNDTLYEFYSKASNLFPFHKLEKNNRIEIIKGREYLDKPFGLSDDYYSKKEEHIKVMLNSERRIIIDILEH